MSKYFVKNAKVRHNFSMTIGVILNIEKRVGGYNYLIQWEDNNFSDWYKKSVLVLL